MTSHASHLLRPALWLAALPALRADESAAVAGPVASTTTTVVALALMNLCFVATLAVVLWNLSTDPKWSLGSALSEGGGGRGAAPNPTPPPPPGAWPAPMAGVGTFAAVPPPPAGLAAATAGGTTTGGYDSSSSRLIAFFGMLVTVFLFFGFGNWVLWQCFQSGKTPGDIDRLIWFLGGGSALFVPYAVNQARGALEDFAKLSRRP
jgi:hypothetical protein